jgi:hypothetical protein
VIPYPQKVSHSSAQLSSVCCLCKLSLQCQSSVLCSSAEMSVFVSPKPDLRRKFALAKLLHFDSEPAPIRGIEHLYIGSVGCVLSSSALQAAGITHTLCVGEGVEAPSEEILSETGIFHRNIGVLDKPDVDIQAIFDSCFDFIEDTKRCGGHVLVYCFQGKSRSATVLTAYLMKHYDMSFVTSLTLIRETRPAASPNLGFIVSLRKYERLLRGEIDPSSRKEEKAIEKEIIDIDRPPEHSSSK